MIRLFCIFLFLASCAVQPVLKPPADPSASADQPAAIIQFARHGDWLVIRGVHDTDNFVATAKKAALAGGTESRVKVSLR
jgi:hypothetical protein